MKQYITFSVLLLTAACSGFGLFQLISGDTVNAAGPAANPPAIVPGFKVNDLDGKERTQKDWAGKYQLINFWATWCPPCVKEVPLLIDLQKQFGERELQIIGIATDDVDAVKAFAEKYQINYPLLVGEMNTTLAAINYGNGLGALPYSILVSPEGKPLYNLLGELEHESITAVLDQHLPKK